MSNADDLLPGAISAQQRRWLDEQIELWQRDGLISADQAAAIRGRYPPPEALEASGVRRVLRASFGLAVLMCAAGLLLLIGYNWSALGRETKTLIIFGGVAAAFAASAAAYARQQPLAGELLAFLGTLIYGSGIWLLAQAYHMPSAYPDGTVWWAVGTLAVGHLVVSRLIALEGVALLFVWSAQVSGWGEPWIFPPLAIASGWLAYRLRSVFVLRATIVAVAFWMVIALSPAWGAGPVAVGFVVLWGFLAQAIGAWHPQESLWRRAWQRCGLLVSLTALMVMTFGMTHFMPEQTLFNPLPIGTLTGAMGLTALVGFLRPYAKSAPESPRVLAIVTIVAILAWVTVALASASTLRESRAVLAALASCLVVGWTLWLVQRGVNTEKAWFFFGGVTYGVLFVFVRVVSLIQNMLWSALVLFAAGALLLVATRYWMKRHAHLPLCP